MDSNCRAADPPEAVGEKRPAENGDELGLPAAKKARSGGGSMGTVRRVAEIVMVLSAMGKMRGGRSPTSAETEMMAEAREKLAAVCEEFAPKNVFPRDAFGAVMEDLGLNKLREQKLGFRPPKMSIAEKVLLTKQKRLHTNLGVADKLIHAPISAGGLQHASPLGHVSAANSASLPYQLPASEVRTTPGSSGLPTSLLGRDSSSTPLPRVDRPHFRLDPRSNGSIAPQIQVNSSGNHTLQKTPAWSQQSQSTPSGKTGPDNKVLPHPSVKVEGTVSTNPLRVASHAAASKPVITQTTSGHLPAMHQHVQGMNFVQAPLLSNVHSEIGKIVQKLLQPQLPEHPKWTPPSRDYMNKALACQVCKLIINEVENVLVCDACEKGYHLKCLQSHNQKGVPRGEWHCFKCLALSNGKPLPPKYGRVTRNITTPKVPSSTLAVQSSPEDKVGTLGEKGNQPKITANGSSGLQSASTGSMDNSNNHSAFDTNMQNATEVQGNDILSTGEKMDDKGHFEACPNDAIRSSRPACVSSVACSSFEGSHEEKLVSELKGQSPAKPSEPSSKTLDHLQASGNPQNNVQKELPDAGIPLMQCHDNKLTVLDTEKSLGSKTFDCNPNDDIKQEEQGVVRADPSEISGTSIRASHNPKSSSEGSSYVDWIGDVLKVVDEKTYYESCCINGVVYEVQDHALFCSNSDKVIPSKLQSMWEDNKTRSKCIIVNRCYFPSDLPEAVGRPCSPESNEVYESTHGSTIMAGLIRGPCEVLPPSKFIEESERRSRLGTGTNNGLRPVFLCKWFFDEAKGVFRDVSS
ncbi:uncharacterized protein LOC130762923 [Actinidia eriantha]|uniref:uncharacterized protein LOC130762923 n=1 Tax=Actinidia eriantha TaxID=165200 RepID=UPI002582FC49|nr:uncharacterized protein LOC130762923 [Actinidia eriantha]